MWALQLWRDAAADGGFLCDKDAVLGVTIKCVLRIKKLFTISTYKALTKIYETRNEVSLD